jgi:hypothetical protein
MGPLRLNLSGSGIGVSAGVRGARVGIGPRGTYVTLGRGGFLYRQKIGGAGRPAPNVPRDLARPLVETQVAVEAPGFIASASTVQLAETTPGAALRDAAKSLQRPNLSWAYALTCGILALVALANTSGPVALLLSVGLIAGGVAVFRWDRERRTARILYDIDSPELVERLAMANGVGQWLGHCASLWHVYYSAPTTDWKHNAGAGTLIRRTPARSALGTLPKFELNIETWCVPVGPQQLLFLPDRLLVWDGRNLAGLPYDSLHVGASTTSFIEEGRPPPDARQVRTTWRFVKRDGGPDLRFGNNAQLPVMEYGELDIQSAAGLRVVLQTSNPAAADGAARALVELARRASARI